MKKNIYSYFTIAAISSLISCSPQKVYVKDNKLMGVLPLENERVIYREKFSAPGLSKAEIFRRARRWWVLSYKNSKDVLQLADDKTGELIGKGYAQAVSPHKRADMTIKLLTHSTLSLDAREGEYTVSSSQIGIASPYYYPIKPIEEYRRSPEQTLIRSFQAVDSRIKETYSSLNNYILKEEYN